MHTKQGHSLGEELPDDDDYAGPEGHDVGEVGDEEAEVLPRAVTVDEGVVGGWGGVELVPGALQVVVGGGDCEEAHQDDGELGVVLQGVPPRVERGLGLGVGEDPTLGHGRTHPQSHGESIKDAGTRNCCNLSHQNY